MADAYDAFDYEYRIDYIGLPVHPEWRKNIKRWQYYSDSYNGGNDYRSGEYLTRYILESGGDYESRIRNTALDNHCKSVIETYNSFLFRLPPMREYGSIDQDPALDSFLADADLDGRNFNAFMRDTCTFASVYGNVWVGVDKPNTVVGTRADELEQGIRPYVNLLTPENVLDWKYARQPSGRYALTEITILDGMDEENAYYRIITPETIQLRIKVAGKPETQIMQEMKNTVGVVPYVAVYAGRGVERGVGVSDIADIADMQRSIYNEYSELEQLIRISNHPSLVKTSQTEAAAGAGAIIDLPEDLDPNLKPYLLEPSGSGISHIIESISNKVDAINRMANMGGTRATATRQMSGVALETELQILNARLSQKADLLELAEEQIWRLWAIFQGKVFDGVIDYPDNFNIHDKAQTVAMLKTIKETNPQNPMLLEHIDIMLAETIVKDEDKLAEIKAGQQQPTQPGMTHPSLEGKTQSQKIAHIQDMIGEGLSDADMLELHPEINQGDIDTARAELG